MRYTIYINAHLTREIMHKADTLKIGIIEEVLCGLISWHDIYSEEIPATLDFIRENFGNITVKVAETYFYSLSCCYDLETMEVELCPDGDKIRHLVKKSQAEEILRDLKGMYKGDALYIDTIINAVTEEGFWKLIKYGLIESCGEFDGRKLYAI